MPTWAGSGSAKAGTAVALSLTAGLALCSSAVPAWTADSPALVAYAPTWIDPAAMSAQLQFDKLTRIDLAFANPDDAGALVLTPTAAGLIFRAHAHGVRVVLSIGGAAASADAATVARYAALLATSVGRQGFVARIARQLAGNDLDGLDVDLEGAAIAQVGHYGEFITDLAAALHPLGKTLSAALSSTNGGAAVPDAALTALDAVQMMAYDASGPWDPAAPGPSAPMAQALGEIAYWHGARGVPLARLILGVPGYGWGFGAAASADPYAFKTIVARYPGAEDADQAGSTIFYNGIPTIRAKTALVSAQGLGGIMIWSIDDDATGARSLVSAIQASLVPTLRVAAPAAADANPLPGPGTTSVHARGDDPEGGSVLTYTWSVAAGAPAPVTFSANGTNAAQRATAMFTRPGSYGLRVTIADPGGEFVTSAVTVIVAAP